MWKKIESRVLEPQAVIKLAGTNLYFIGYVLNPNIKSDKPLDIKNCWEFFRNEDLNKLTPIFRDDITNCKKIGGNARIQGILKEIEFIKDCIGIVRIKGGEERQDPETPELAFSFEDIY